MNKSIQTRYLGLLDLHINKPGMDYLGPLIRAHLTRFPFENISKLYFLKKQNKRDIPTLEQYLDGNAEYGFGGTCYSNNYYFFQLLKSLGFDAILCGADMTNPDVHMNIIVRFDSQSYMVDVGYAAPFLEPIPLDLDTKHEFTFGRDHYIIHPLDVKAYNRLELIRNGESIHGYKAKRIPRTLHIFEPAIKSSFQPESTFVNSILLTRFKEDRFYTIHNYDLIISTSNNTIIEKLGSYALLKEAIADLFGIPEFIVDLALDGMNPDGNPWS